MQKAHGQQQVTQEGVAEPRIDQWLSVQAQQFGKGACHPAPHPPGLPHSAMIEQRCLPHAQLQTSPEPVVLKFSKHRGKGESRMHVTLSLSLLDRSWGPSHPTSIGCTGN